MKIVVCGGHHNSALVVAEKLRKKGDEIIWFGHKYSMVGDKNPSAEFLEVTGKGFPFVEIKAGKFQPRYHFFWNLLRVPQGFWQSFTNLLRLSPNLIISFGSYLALPVVICGWMLKIPSVTHEQTTVSGLANKIIAKFCRKIFVCFPSSLAYFPKDKTVLAGLPVRRELFKKGRKLFNNSRKTICIFGGKQGSHVLNEAVFSILSRLLENFNVIHQCGSTSLFNDIRRAGQLKSSLGGSGERYLVKEYFFDSEIGQIYNSADFVVCRAGAHTVYELGLLNKPAILVPIPWSTGGEQQKNAEMLVDFGLAKILSQADLQSGRLYETIWNFSQNLKNYRLQTSYPFLSNAAETIVKEIEKLCPS